MLNLLFLQVAVVPQISDPSNFTAAYEAMVPSWISAVYPYAGELFAALALLDISVFGWTLIRKYGSNLQGAILSTANRLVLIGAFLALLMNGSAWMGYIIQMFIQVGKAGSGVTAIQPSVVLEQGVRICFALLGQAALSGAMMDPTTSLCMVVAALAVAFSFLFVSAEFVLTKVQTFLALGMGFFFLGFGGSGWTRNYVERYFAYAVSSGVRLMANYFLIGIGINLSNGWLTQAQHAPWSLDGVKAAWIVMFGAILFATIAWKGSAIAAQLLGGGPNLSHSDVFHAVGTAAQAAAAAVLIGSGIASGAVGGGSAASSAGGARVAGAAAPSGSGSTPPSQPLSSNGNGSSGVNGYQAASATAGVLHGFGGGGSYQVHPPPFKGFHNED